MARDHRAPKSFHGVRQRGGDDARFRRFLSRREKVSDEFEGRKQANAAPVFVHDWQTAQVLVVNQLNGVINSGIGSHRGIVAPHDIAAPG
jgi:hypothetical protein